MPAPSKKNPSRSATSKRKSRKHRENLSSTTSHLSGKPKNGKDTPKHRKKTNKKPVGTCFVLMPFKEPFDSYYNVIIRPAVTAAGLEPLRGDSLFRPSPIMADIWSMIQNAKVLVAELTEKNANVFYELGLGHAVGKPIVLMSETIDDVPFDLQPLRVIIYDKDNPAWGLKLRSSLTSALAETISNPSNAVPSMFRKIVKSQAPKESKTAARLSSLEQQIALLEQSNRLPRLGQEIIPSLSDFRDRVRSARNRDDAAQITFDALESRFSQSRLRKVLTEIYGPAEARKIFAVAKLPMATKF
jgi:hypothetical protein